MITIEVHRPSFDFAGVAFEKAEKEIRNKVDQYALVVEREIQKNLSTLMRRRTGQLARDLRDFKVIPISNGFAIEFTTGAPYARIQEHGGKIEARSGSYLTVPLPAALPPAGVLKKRAKFWKNTFVQRSKKNNLIIFQNKGENIVPLFVLKKQVVIEATHWFSKAITATESDFNRMVGN